MPKGATTTHEFVLIVLDLAMLQAFALHQVIDARHNVLDFVSFKRSICESLVLPLRSQQKHCRSSEKENSNLMESVVGTVGDSDGHLLIETINKTGIHCHFCLLRGVKRKTIYGCTKCGRGFYVNCYTAVHFQGALKSDTAACRHDIEYRKTIAQEHEQKVQVCWR
jgi:ribosomal protein L37AE/L43A